ncbi:MAG: M42 family peptidase, partial [Firmicutes bacterium]|nr:M42 family peptidase [Bacillota bacterium]
VPTGVISIPTRYAHSSVEMMDWGDFEASEKLLEAFMLGMRSKEQFAFI